MEISGPLTDALIYYLTVILVCEGARHVADHLFDKKGSVHRFIIEFLGTLQVTTTIYENAVIDIYLGRQAFAITLFSTGLIFALCNRTAFCSPLAPIEQYLFGKLRLGELLQTLAAQFTAGYFAFSFARTIWLRAYSTTDAHSYVMGLMESCGFNHPYPIYYHLAIELIGTFIVRHVLTRATSEARDSRVRFVFPALFMAAVFTGTVTFVGDQALDPLVASTLFFGCRGLNFENYMLVYWIAPTIGWMASAYWDSTGEESSKKKAAKEKKAEKKRAKKNE
ncbi:Aquaporin [Caenorhabditis elegans]|uniref:Aquaporin n=1 Tax=Caenorhabditis elegans TaxID=6239 RepID=O46024_CAEEL|nr:Aquaporin [Caenorhabditis elegans]CAB05023.2 Aquaporin [Caenorhabditis elegans]|eukprot:NP_499821.2 Aquaporin [Caenorhabditis elegans]